MMKIYTNETKTSKEQVKSPKASVINDLLNYSKSLEVIKLKSAEKEKGRKNAEVILN